MAQTAPISEPLTRVELRFACTKLANMDVLSKSDPQIVAYARNAQGRWVEIGRTEIIMDNLNPTFAKAIPIEYITPLGPLFLRREAKIVTHRSHYYFERTQNLKFSVLDIDNFKTARVEEQDLIGEVDVTLGEIVGAAGSQLVRPIRHQSHKKRGFLIITATEIEENKADVTLSMAASHLDKKDFLGKSDPFVEISAARDDGSWLLLHRSEFILKTLNPTWQPVTLPFSKLSGKDDTRPIRFQVFDWNKSGKSDFIGEFTASLKEILSKKDWELINQKKLGKKKYRNSGVFHFQSVTVQKAYSFLDYIAGGCEIHLVVAIDYTASNGDPRYSNSLHYQNPYQPNEYQRAIQVVGDILMAYDSDGNVPVFGFGAKMPNGQEKESDKTIVEGLSLSHCFNVNGHPTDPEVPGVKGILHAYTQSFASGITLYGPTNFAEIIRTASNLAQQMYLTKSDIQAYEILLIVTDGEITDMDATIREIVNASHLPLSIIIVGVGNADFTKMDILDGDDDGAGRLRYQGKYAERDIVQFVAFRDYRNTDISKLAADVLHEVPGQFLSFMRTHKIQPRPPPDPAQMAKIQQDQINALLRAASSVSQLPPSQPMMQQPQVNAAPPLQRAPSTYPPQPQPQPGAYPPQPHPQLQHAPSVQGYPPSQPGYPQPQQAPSYPQGQSQPYPGAQGSQQIGSYPPQNSQSQMYPGPQRTTSAYPPSPSY